MGKRKNQKGLLQGGASSLLLGLFGVNPVLALAIGGGVAYVQSSKKAQDWLFGEEGKVTKIKNWFKSNSKRLGTAGLGAIFGGLSFGPLGAIAGAGAGFALSSDKAKLWLFGDGDKDKGKIDKVKKMVYKAL